MEAECLLPPAALELRDWMLMGRELKCLLLLTPWMRRSGMLWTVYWCGDAEIPHEVPRLLLREGLIRVAWLSKGAVGYELVEQQPPAVGGESWQGAVENQRRD